MNNWTKIIVYSLSVSAVISSSFHPVGAQAQIPQQSIRWDKQAQVKQTVAVLGDSYSTFEGFIPKGYATWYTTAVQKATDVNKVEQTWWWQVIK